MPDILVGCALSDVNRADLPRNLRVPERLTDYIELYQARVESRYVLLELQPEGLWTVPATFPDQFIPRKNNRWWRTVQSQPDLLVKLRAPNMRVGVHQPIQNRDALSSNFFHKYEAIEATKQAMEFAESIDADYFVFHLAHSFERDGQGQQVYYRITSSLVSHLMKILLVEDEEGLIITLTDRLRSEGFDVTSANDGRMGLDFALEQHFDLMILDVMLPKKNGYDVCRDLRQKGVDTPILMLTAKGETIDKVLGLKLGADELLDQTVRGDRVARTR